MLRRFIALQKAILFGKRLSSRQERWDRNWSTHNYVPAWEARQIPAVLQQAVESGWLPAGARLLDIGCGTGSIAAWLAGRGYRVTGIDLAASAIGRARALHQGPELRYTLRDICGPLADPKVFDCLFDRGCLHGIPDEGVSQYILNVRAASEPGTRFLLLHKMAKESRLSEHRRISNVETRSAALLDHFALERTSEIDMLTGGEIGPETTYPGVAFWLVRK